MALPFKSHWLRRNHGNHVPNSVCVVQTIADECKDAASSKHYYKTLHCGAAAFFRWEGGQATRWRTLTFWSAEQLWEWLVSFHVDRRALWLFSHRLGETLTLTRFWDLLDNGFYRLENLKGKTVNAGEPNTATPGCADYLLCTRDPPTIVMASHQEHFLRAVDVRNYFPETLDELAELVGTERTARPDWKAPDEAWEAHASRDVEIVKQTLCRLFKWWEDGDYGVFRYTASALAFSAYRHKHLKEKILIDDDEPSRLLSREALSAGECRLFYCGQIVDPLSYGDQAARTPKGKAVRLRPGPVHVFDMNGSYAAVMRGNLFPRKLVAYKPNATVDDVYDWQKQLCLVARVRLVTPERPFPVWAQKRRWFAVGDYWTTLAGPELRDAAERGFIRAVTAVAAYLPGRLFTSFIDDFYPQAVQATADGRAADARFLKMMYKSLAGKFGQKEGGWNWSDMPGFGPKWGTFPRAIDGNADSRLYRLIAGYVQQLDDQVDALDSLPAIEAFVNAYGRLYMAGVRDRLPAGSVFYQDTDSLHVNDDGANALHLAGLVHQTELGKFHLERSALSATYRGPKDYTIDGEHVVAGRKPDPIRQGKSFYLQSETVNLDTILALEPNGTVKMAEVRKRFGHYHPAGICYQDGRVTPAVVEQERVFLVPRHRRA